ncbi:MAG: DNA alkylation repair protein [Candidatus Bathyarchaeales archaeon]
MPRFVTSEILQKAKAEVVKKAANWALRNIGKRNPNLNKKAIETAKEIKKWIREVHGGLLLMQFES